MIDFGSIRMDLVFENLKSRKVGQKNKFKPAAASSPLSLSLSLSFCPVERLNSPDVIAVQGKVRVPTLVVTVSKCEYITQSDVYLSCYTLWYGAIMALEFEEWRRPRLWPSSWVRDCRRLVPCKFIFLIGILCRRLNLDFQDRVTYQMRLWFGRA